MAALPFRNMNMHAIFFDVSRFTTINEDAFNLRRYHMNTSILKLAGLALAVMGSLTLVQAESGESKGPHKGKGGKQGQRPSREQLLEKFDTDGDGQLNEEERAAMREAAEKHRGGKDGERPSREEILEKFDADGDGQLSEEERAAAREAMGGRKGRRGHGNREEMMKKYDTDGDGELNEEERAAMREEFEKRKKEQRGEN
jgi:Ca2+-binding EF-hand superfamily protein